MFTAARPARPWPTRNNEQPTTNQPNFKDLFSAPLPSSEHWPLTTDHWLSVSLVQNESIENSNWRDWRDWWERRNFLRLKQFYQDYFTFRELQNWRPGPKFPGLKFLFLAKIIDALLPSLEPMTRRVAMMMALRGLTTSSVMAEPDEWSHVRYRRQFTSFHLVRRSRLSPADVFLVRFSWVLFLPRRASGSDEIKVNFPELHKV